jgi:hypothetical protein
VVLTFTEMSERKVWVLDTETKGTGAEMVPLEKTQRRPAPSAEPFWAPPPRRPREPAPPPARAPRRFRVVDVLSGEPLGSELSARETVELLRGVRSTVDVRIYMREDERWRLLRRDEQAALWRARDAA